ncbi:MAG: hypothetical protein HRT88_00755 [Lentisphaeraceae bacterium]|nr:hypothetical protein [Lentisphaeraceae bacterium]
MNHGTDHKEPAKQCLACEKKFPPTLDYFQPEPKVKCGLSAQCKVCIRATAKRKRQKRYAQQVPCNIALCTDFVHSGTKCDRHMLQLQRFGKIKQFTRSQLNVIKTVGNVCYMEVLSIDFKKVLGTVMFDEVDLPKITGVKWALHTTSCRYSIRSQSQPFNIINRILPPKGKLLTQNIDGNIWDCRRANLTMKPRMEVSRKSSISKKNTSGHKGVTWTPISNKWWAFLQVNGKRYSGGYHKNIQDAINARKELESLHWK